MRKISPFLTSMATLTLCACTHQIETSTPTMITMGDGYITGKTLQPYSFTWTQCSLQDGTWINGPELTEELNIIDDNTLQLKQSSQQPDGRMSVGDTYLNKTSLSPTRMETKISGADKTVLAKVERTLDENGITSMVTRGGETQTKTGEINSQMYHGGALGLPLLNLDYDKGTYAFDSSMVSMNGTYQTFATKVGTEVLRHAGKEVETILVDVKWIHNESGDIYQPGPDASGGRYWLVPNPPAGFPYVPRYKTDTYAIEFIQATCPAPEK